MRNTESAKIRSIKGQSLNIEYKGIEIEATATREGKYQVLIQTHNSPDAAISVNETFELIKDVDLQRKSERVYLAAIVRQFTEQADVVRKVFGKKEEEKVYQMLTEYTTPKPTHQKPVEHFEGNPHQAYIDSQRERFCNAWVRIFRDNISDPATIDRLLGE